MLGEPGGFPRSTPIPRKLTFLQRLGFVGLAQCLAEPVAVLALEGAPDVGSFSARLDQPIEHGLVAHAEHALDLENARQQRTSTRGVPFRGKRRLRHEKGAGEGVGFTLRLHGNLGDVALIFGGMQQQVAEFVCRGKNPAFNRNPIPRIDDHSRTSVAPAHAQPEKRFPIRLQEQKFYPIVLKQHADVTDRLFWSETDRLASILCDLYSVAVASRRGCLLEPEWGPLVQVCLKCGIGVKPLRDFRQDLLSRINPRLGTKTHAFKGPDGDDEFADRDRQRLRQSVKGACPWDDLTAFNLSEGYP